MSVVLAVDDEPAILQFLELVLDHPDIRLCTAGTAAAALKAIEEFRPDLILLDVDLPDLSGLETFRRLKEIDARIPTIFMTGSGSTTTAIEAMALGAFEYLLKPLQVEALRALVARALEVSRLMREAPRLNSDAKESDKGDVLIGRCPAMQEVCKAIGRVAPQDVTALILGESGTGKELVARAIYHYSKRAAAPFLAINCAAIPENLLESELFGHEKGSFTGAERRHIGKFEQCSGGTLFLDEIGDMSPLTQTKVLRVLNEQRFERVGGAETIATNVRLIAATHRDLESMVAANQFRGDLYYRLNVYTIMLPALRQRGQDLDLLIEHFLRRANRELHKNIERLAPAARELLWKHSWPGNVRELQSVIKQAMLRTTGPVIEPEALPPALREGGRRPPPGPAAIDLDHFVQERLEAGSIDLYAEWLALTEPKLLVHVLQFAGGNLSQAAKILGIDRSTLRTKLRAHGISVERFIAGGDTPA